MWLVAFDNRLPSYHDLIRSRLRYMGHDIRHLNRQMSQRGATSLFWHFLLLQANHFHGLTVVIGGAPLRTEGIVRSSTNLAEIVDHLVRIFELALRLQILDKTT